MRRFFALVAFFGFWFVSMSAVCTSDTSGSAAVQEKIPWWKQQLHRLQASSPPSPSSSPHVLPVPHRVSDIMRTMEPSSFSINRNVTQADLHLDGADLEAALAKALESNLIYNLERPGALMDIPALPLKVYGQIHTDLARAYVSVQGEATSRATFVPTQNPTKQTVEIFDAMLAALAAYAPVAPELRGQSIDRIYQVIHYAMASRNQTFVADVAVRILLEETRPPYLSVLDSSGIAVGPIALRAARTMRVAFYVTPNWIKATLKQDLGILYGPAPETQVAGGLRVEMDMVFDLETGEFSRDRVTILKSDEPLPKYHD